MSSFDDWGRADASDFAMPGDEGFSSEQAAPPAAVEAPAAVPEISEASPHEAALDEALGVIRHYASQDDRLALSEAKALYEDGELGGHEIVEMLNRGAGPAAASEFYEYWRQDVQGEPEPPSPDLWLDEINRKVAAVQQASEQAAQAEAAQAQAEHDQAVNERFTEGVQSAARRLRVPYGSELRAFVDRMGAELTPSVDEAPLVGEKLVRQFASVKEAAFAATLAADLEGTSRKDNAAGFWTTPVDVPKTWDESFQRRLIEDVGSAASEPSRTDPRPTRTAQLMADWDEANATRDLVADNWKV